MRSLGATPPYLCSLTPGAVIDCPAPLTPLHFLLVLPHHVHSWCQPEMNLCVCPPPSPSAAPSFNVYFCAASPLPQLSTLTVHAAGSIKSTESAPPTKPSFECYLCLGIREEVFRKTDQKQLRLRRFPFAWLEDCAPLCAAHFPPYVTASLWLQACPRACALSLVQD